MMTEPRTTHSTRFSADTRTAVVRYQILAVDPDGTPIELHEAPRNSVPPLQSLPGG